jgi:hypothetical protein
LLLYVGRLDREKSVDRVLLAFERIAARCAARALAGRAGQGEPSAAASGRASPAGDRDLLRRRARARSAGRWYQAADLFLFASETETQGLVLAEAAACGLPAVAVLAPAPMRSSATARAASSPRAILPRWPRPPSACCSTSRGAPAWRARARLVAEAEFDVERQITRTLDVSPARQRAAARPASMTEPRAIRVCFQKDWTAAERRGCWRPIRACARLAACW